MANNTLGEKYWLTILFCFGRYFSLLMMLSGIAFILLGVYINPWYYAGLASWPLFLMWGATNFRYLKVMAKERGLEIGRYA